MPQAGHSSHHRSTDRSEVVAGGAAALMRSGQPYRVGGSPRRPASPHRRSRRCSCPGFTHTPSQKIVESTLASRGYGVPRACARQLSVRTYRCRMPTCRPADQRPGAFPRTHPDCPQLPKLRHQILETWSLESVGRPGCAAPAWRSPAWASEKPGEESDTVTVLTTAPTSLGLCQHADVRLRRGW